jgi:hypothetical protein
MRTRPGRGLGVWVEDVFDAFELAGERVELSGIEPRPETDRARVDLNVCLAQVGRLTAKPPGLVDLDPVGVLVPLQVHGDQRAESARRTLGGDLMVVGQCVRIAHDRA